MNRELPAQIEDLFVRCPALCGFSVGGSEEQLEVDDVSVLPVLNRQQLGELLEDIAVTLADLVAGGMALRGRTFARVLH
jgi:hypothetical protein